MNIEYKKPSISFYEFLVEDIITGSVLESTVVSDSNTPIVNPPDQGGIGEDGLD